MFDPERDIALAQRMVTGDAAAFEALYGHYSKALKNYFYRFCYDEREAEDLVHETFMRLWRTRDRYQPLGKFSTYLFQIAKNLWINTRERKMRNPVKTSLDPLPDGVGRLPAGRSESALASPSDTIERAELVDLLTAAIDELPEKHRDVVVLGRLQGLKYKDIAEILDIPVGTVKSRMANAEAKLREKLGKLL